MKPYYEESGIQIFHGDCREVLPTIQSVDAVITDPPYSLSTHEGARGRGATTGGKHLLVDFDCLTPEEMVSVVRLLLCSARRWVIAFTDIFLIHPIKAAGLPLIRVGAWVKNDPAPQFSGDRPAVGWEPILMLHNEGRKRWNGGGRPSVYRTNIAKNLNHHPTQKPLTLMGQLVRDFSDPSETVLDPFMGSGTTLRAAKDLGRQAIGIEIEERYCEIAAERLRQSVLPLSAEVA